MKAMKDAPEYVQAAPPGRYPSRIVNAEPQPSKKDGHSMIKLTSEIISPPQYAGQQAEDYLGTDGTTKHGGFSKARLRNLGVNVETNDEIPDATIAQGLLGRVYDVEYGNEPRMTRSSEGGPYDREQTAVDPRTGLTIVLQKLTIKNYHPASVGVQTLPSQAPQQQQFQQAPQGYAPQHAPQQGLPQQAAPQLQFAPQPQGQPQGQFAPQGLQPQFAPQPIQQQYAQPPFQPQASQQFAQQAPLPQQGLPAQQLAVPGVAQGQMPWIQPPNGAVAGAPQQPEVEEGGKKRGRRSAAEQQG